ncbi:alpha/beta fold hydrolase [Nocardiopsis composta]|uniref:Pimeloyl-ACP methyl ester carboxylesterase n=1 Tax=Nocardiopsis composta TaxID=157465 RepID=A0A7W8QTB5_9ACTN|nr:alpha/beta fold hydrolase [Nocardiopsis composta]MBB5436207.1 pimeloyl-ACP methyl ester carboxylesterase [Nocardiopsis composta]
MSASSFSGSDASRRPNGAGPRPASGRPGAGRPGLRRWLLAAAVLATAGLLLANAVAVSRESAGAAGDLVLHLDGGGVQVHQDGPRGAPALVLVHGLAGSARWWDPLVPALAESHRVIRVDLLGHGRSAKPAGGGYAIPEQGRLVGEVLDRLGVRRAVLVGHSTGGSVATALAEQRPGLVTGLALIGSGPRLGAFVSDGFVGRLLSTPVVGQLLWRVRTDGVVRRGLETAFSRPGYGPPQELVDDVRGMTYRSLTATSRAADDYLAERALPDRLAGLGEPLLVVFGEDDRRWRAAASAADYRAVPGARVELLPGIGHSPMLEDPPRTAGILLSFAGGAAQAP